jgi:alpha-1,2-mannosyltransferase
MQRVLEVDKLNLFFAVRSVLALITSFAESSFTNAIYQCYGQRIGSFSVLFTMFSSGILYSATSFLPSAVIMSLVMLAAASWMTHYFERTIFWGCLAVLWSGWPFAGVIFVPLGLHMLYDASKSSTGILRVLQLVFSGAVILVVCAASAAVIDIHMYGKR